MQNRKSENINEFSSDLKARFFSFLDVRYVPVVSLVCKDWKQVLEVNPMTVKKMVGHSAAIPPEKIPQLPSTLSELKKAHQELQEYKAKQQHSTRLASEIKHDANDLAIWHEQAQRRHRVRYFSSSVMASHSSSPMLMTKEVQAVGCATGLTTCGVASLISHLTCPGCLSVAAIIGFVSGWVGGGTIKTHRVILRHEKNRREKTALDRSLSSLEMPLLTRIVRETESKELKEEVKQDGMTASDTRDQKNSGVSSLDEHDSSLYFRLT